jgi:hypothetical protein
MTTSTRCSVMMAGGAICPWDAPSVVNPTLYTAVAIARGEVWFVKGVSCFVTRRNPFISLRYVLDHHLAHLAYSDGIIQVWQSTHFRKTSLSSLNVRYQLGHSPNSTCLLVKPAHRDFLVIHNNGFHHVLVNFCGCQPGYHHHQQLLDHGWFPATPKEPKTCATFAVMQLFHNLNLQAKTTAYDFDKVLGLLTDATGLSDLPVRLLVLYALSSK